jgi:hypothetical protein
MQGVPVVNGWNAAEGALRGKRCSFATGVRLAFRPAIGPAARCNLRLYGSIAAVE